MSDAEPGRHPDNRAALDRATERPESVGRGAGERMVGLGLAATAALAAVVSRFLEGDTLTQTVPAVILVAGLIGLYVRARRSPGLDPEVVHQVAVSLVIYGVVWVAACGFQIAGMARLALGPYRTATLHASSVGLLLIFAAMLVSSALRSRQRYYAFGLALSTLLAGVLLPVLDWHYSYPLAHGLMAVGYLAGVAIQAARLRMAVGHPSEVG